VVQSQPGVSLRHGWRFESFEEDDSGITSVATDLASGTSHRIRSRWLVACDGGTSSIRRTLGIRYNGRGKMRANVSFYFRSKDFLKIHGKGLGNLYFVFAPDSFGVFTAIDGVELWSFQYYFLDHSKGTPRGRPAVRLRALREHAVASPPVGGKAVALRQRARLPGRRQRPPVCADRRRGHEHRHRRCDGSGLEACCL